MTRWRTRAPFAVLGLLSVLRGADARAEAPVSAAPPAPSNEQCAASYEQAQEERKSGRLTAARDTLRLCARDECPSFIHDDCVTWYAEVQAELPTVVFGATGAGRDLVDVTVATARGSLASRLEGQVIELDPGEYELSFSAPGFASRKKSVVVVRGERNRLVRVELEPLTASSPVDEAGLIAPPPSRSLTAPALFAGVGLAGVGGFFALGAWGRASESELADTCAPGCAGNDVASIRTRYVLADVSLGVGVASLALAAYTFSARAPRRRAKCLGSRSRPRRTTCA